MITNGILVHCSVVQNDMLSIQNLILCCHSETGVSATTPPVTSLEYCVNRIANKLLLPATYTYLKTKTTRTFITRAASATNIIVHKHQYTETTSTPNISTVIICFLAQKQVFHMWFHSHSIIQFA